ncbi:hypothetical protein [Fulvivirga ligni]|nr:hypothetical protein [Fulvivirga ligni]UII23046.1 hypothetical protein LVD16_07385 [Fulvivirga ligni]
MKTLSKSLIPVAMSLLVMVGAISSCQEEEIAAQQEEKGQVDAFWGKHHG